LKFVRLIVDGSALSNPGVGGWACILQYETRERVLKWKVDGRRGSSGKPRQLWVELEAQLRPARSALDMGAWARARKNETRTGRFTGTPGYDRGGAA
jgi:hypothetical protein